VGLGLLALVVLPVVVLALFGAIRRFQIARTSRELERMGFVGDSPYASDTRPIWPRLVAGSAGLITFIVLTSVLAARPSVLPPAPLARTQASGAGPSLQDAPTEAAVVPASLGPGSEHSATHSTASPGVASPHAASAASTPPTADDGDAAGAPSAVTALPTSATAIRLEWARVDGADHYEIEQSTDNVAWNHVGSTDSGQTRYIDMGLSSGTTYFYRVVSVNDQDVSRSDVVSATTAVDTSTAPVLSATGSSTSIELEWTDVDGEVLYRIERSSDGAGDWAGIGTTGQGITSFTDAGLAPATTYYYRVVAVTLAGESPPSGIAWASTDADAPSTSEANIAPSEAP